MNVFYLHENPTTAAQVQCDKHVVKMVLETAQMLSAVCARYDIIEEDGYRVTHRHHPCTLWAGDSRDNFDWLVKHGRALSDEYTERYGKVHKSRRVIDLYAQHRDAVPDIGPTPPAQAMPVLYKGDDPVMAYRRDYTEHKRLTMSMPWKANLPDWSPQNLLDTPAEAG